VSGGELRCAWSMHVHITRRVAASVGRKRARGTEKLVPVALIGFKGLKDRMEQQDRIVTQFAGFAQDLSASLHEMELASQQSKAKIEKLRHKHILLSQRLIRVRSTH